MARSKRVGRSPTQDGGRRRKNRVSASVDEERQMEMLEQTAASLETQALESSAGSMVTQSATDREQPGRARRAGTTQVSLSAPSDGPAAPPSAGCGRVTRAAALGAASKARGAVESRLVDVLEQAVTASQRRRASLEAGLLMRLRRTLRSQAEALPADVVLSEALCGYVEEAHGIVADLQEGGAKAAWRFVAYARELAGEVAALGGSAGDAKTRLGVVSERLASASGADPAKAVKEAHAAVLHLESEMRRLCPSRPSSLLDELSSRG